MENASGIFSNIAFWITIVGGILTALSAIILFVIKGFKKSDDDLFHRMRKLEEEFSEHLGWHKGKENGERK